MDHRIHKHGDDREQTDPAEEGQDGIQGLQDVRGLIAHHLEVLVNQERFSLFETEDCIDDLVEWDEVEPGDLCDELEGEHSILRIVEVEQSHQDYELQSVNRAPEHLQGG